MIKYKRQMPQSTRDKISAKMQGRKLSDQTKQKISNAIKKAWATVPQKNNSNLRSNFENNENNTNLSNEKY